MFNHRFSNINTKNKIITMVAVLALSAITLTGCGSKNNSKIDTTDGITNILDYVTVDFSGKNGEGTAYVNVDYDGIETEMVGGEEKIKEMDEIEDLDQINISDEKKRELEYKNAVNSKDPRKLIRIIKTMYFRRKARIESGKKSTAIDERYFRIAENRLYEEMALALDIDREEVKEYIRNYIEKK